MACNCSMLHVDGKSKHIKHIKLTKYTTLHNMSQKTRVFEALRRIISHIREFSMCFGLFNITPLCPGDPTGITSYPIENINRLSFVILNHLVAINLDFKMFQYHSLFRKLSCTNLRQRTYKLICFYQITFCYTSLYIYIYIYIHRGCVYEFVCGRSCRCFSLSHKRRFKIISAEWLPVF